MTTDVNTVMVVKEGESKKDKRKKKSVSPSDLNAFGYPLLAYCNLTAFTLWKVLSL